MCVCVWVWVCACVCVCSHVCVCVLNICITNISTILPYVKYIHYKNCVMANPVFIYLFYLFIYLFGVLRRYQHCTGHITTGSWKGGGNQYIQLVCQGFCTVNCRPTASNYQLSHLRPCREQNPGLRGGRRECYHSATVVPS